MKKLLFVLLVVALAAYLLVGCIPVTPPAEGEGEGEGESEVSVVIDGAVVIDGKTYVSAGPHDITVTFPAPVAGFVGGYISDCYGDYSKVNGGPGGEVVLFPDADKKVWTGSGYFGCMSENNIGKPPLCPPCCASYVEIYAGECEDEACIWFPVIVDSEYPMSLIEVEVEDCECTGCAISFESFVLSPDCEDAEVICSDYCSGLASWSILLYDADPFDECCDPSICEEPIGSCSGTSCPISCVTDCLTAGTYYAVITLVDAVGNETVYYAKIVLSGDGATEDCDIDVWAGYPLAYPECVYWEPETSDTIGG